MIIESAGRFELKDQAQWKPWFNPKALMPFNVFKAIPNFEVVRAVGFRLTDDERAKLTVTGWFHGFCVVAAEILFLDFGMVKEQVFIDLGNRSPNPT